MAVMISPLLGFRDLVIWTKMAQKWNQIAWSPGWFSWVHKVASYQETYL